MSKQAPSNNDDVDDFKKLYEYSKECPVLASEAQDLDQLSRIAEAMERCFDGMNDIYNDLQASGVNTGGCTQNYTNDCFCTTHMKEKIDEVADKLYQMTDV